MSVAQAGLESLNDLHDSLRNQTVVTEAVPPYPHPSWASVSSLESL